MSLGVLDTVHYYATLQHTADGLLGAKALAFVDVYGHAATSLPSSQMLQRAAVQGCSEPRLRGTSS